VSPINEEHIIQRVLNGEDDAYAHLINQHKEMIMALCSKMVQSPIDAEELAQDTFIKAYRQLRSFKGKSKFSTWLYRIAYFTCINHLRKNKQKSVEINEWNHPATGNNDTMDSLTSSDQKLFIQLALNQLKPQERALITLFYLEEQSIAEIAQITGLSKSNTKVKIHRSRKKLRRFLEENLNHETELLRYD